MQTRTTDYSCCDYVLRVFYTKFNTLMREYFVKIKSLDKIKTIYKLNKIFNFIKKNIDNLLNFKNRSLKYIESIENFLKIITIKKSEIKKDIFIIRLRYEIELMNYERDEIDWYKPMDLVLFHKLSTKFDINGDILDSKMKDYYTRKYIFILFKTNRDIYHIVLSYLM